MTGWTHTQIIVVIAWLWLAYSFGVFVGLAPVGKGLTMAIARRIRRRYRCLRGRHERDSVMVGCRLSSGERLGEWATACCKREARRFLYEMKASTITGWPV